MTSYATVEGAIKDASKAISDGDWELASRTLEYLSGAWQRAGLDGDEADEVCRALADLRIRTVTSHDVDQVLGPEAIAWMLAGMGMVVAQAPRACFPALQDVEGKILVALLTHVSPLSTSDLAARIGHDPSVTARSLAKLREFGLVASSSGGRKVFNGITSAGREHVERRRAEVDATRD